MPSFAGASAPGLGLAAPFCGSRAGSKSSALPQLFQMKAEPAAAVPIVPPPQAAPSASPAPPATSADGTAATEEKPPKPAKPKEAEDINLKYLPTSVTRRQWVTQARRISHFFNRSS